MTRTIAAIALLVAAGQATAQTFTWVGSVDQLWSESGNWDLTGIPDVPGESALIGVNATVSADTTVTIDGLVTLSGSETDVVGNKTVTLGADGLTNEGLITINSAGSTLNATLAFDNGGAIDGAGAIVLRRISADDNDARILETSGLGVSHVNGHTISGSGLIDGIFLNNSDIIADDPAFSLVLAGDFTQGGSGVLRADGATLQFANASVTDGTLETANGGVIETTSQGSTLSGVAIEGDVTIDGNSLMVIESPGVLNNGTITLNPDLSTLNATVSVNSDAQFAGVGEIVLVRASSDVNDARLITDNGAIATLGADQVVRGSGGLNGDFVSDARILADDPAQPLFLVGTIDQSGGGMLEADGAELRLGDVVVTGGTIETTNSGRVDADNGDVPTLSGVTNNGDAGVQGNSTLQIGADGFTNEGAFVVNSNSSTLNAAVVFIADATLDGAGTMDLNQPSSDSFDATIDTDDGVTATIGADQTISGRGRLMGNHVQNGTVLADRPGEDLVVAGTFDQTGGGVMRGDAGFITLGDGLITGGTLEGVNGGGAQVQSGADMALDAVTLSGDTGVRGNGTLILAGSITNDGQFVVNTNSSTINAQVLAAADATIGGTGDIFMNRPSSDANDARLDANGFTITLAQDLAGQGSFAGSIVAQGAIAPGASTGSISVQGDLTFESTATYAVELSTTSDFDELTGNGTIALDGTLDIAYINSYSPTFGDSFAIIDGPDVSGEFASITGPTLPGDLVYKVRYETDEAVLVITCPPDTNIDGEVNTLDFLDFLNLWTAGDLDADWNEDGVVNTLDFIDFLNEWTGGCS